MRDSDIRDQSSRLVGSVSVGLMYSNTIFMAALLAVAASVPPATSWLCKVIRTRPLPASDRISRRGRWSDWLSDRLGQVANVILPLITAALVAIAFMHETLRDVPSEAVWKPMAIANVLGSRETGLYLVYTGVAGLMFALIGFALRGAEPNRGDEATPARNWVLWKMSVRWCTRAAGWAALAVVLLVPALVNMLLATLEIPAR